MTKLTSENWKIWLAQSQWTVAEAASLSLGIPPALVEVTKTDYLNNGGFSFGDDDTSYHSVYQINLVGLGRVEGRSVELKLRTRAAILAGVMSNIKIPPRGIDIDMAQPAGTPEKYIIQMRFLEWELPKPLQDWTLSERVGQALLQKPEEPIVPKMSASAKKKAKVLERFAALGLPARFSLTEIEACYDVHRSTIEVWILEDNFPKHDFQGPYPNSSREWLRETILTWDAQRANKKR